MKANFRDLLHILNIYLLIYRTLYDISLKVCKDLKRYSKYNRNI